MDNLDDSENNAKISDSAYSNSCSNSQSRKSHSSKSTHSGSNSSGSSGYGGKPSTSGSSNNLGQPPKKEKEPKKKKLPQADTIVSDEVVETDARAPEPDQGFDAPKEEQLDVIPPAPPVLTQPEKCVENMEICAAERISMEDEVVSSNLSSANVPTNYGAARAVQTPYCSDGFSCVISMHDGVVMYTTSSLTSNLGFPKDMWIGRSFIDFVHPKDRSTFASQITNGLAIPKIVNGTQEKVQPPPNSVSTMVCRIRRYRGLTSGYGVKDRVVGFMPFLLKLTFKNISDEEGKVIYLVIQATPFFSAFKSPNEMVIKAVPFVMRHAANGHIEYVDPESVPYLGYLPQDLADTDALQLYHPDDLHYLCQVYETIVKEGGLPRCKRYRMLTQNGDYLNLETEWSSFINPWSKKLEFVIAKHHVIEGPANPNVFQTADQANPMKLAEEENKKAQILRETIVRIMNEALTKPAEVAKQQMSKRCQDLASFMESLMEDPPKLDDELRVEIQDPDHSYYERDSVMLGGISPHHDYYDSKSSTGTPLSYTQLNYNETLQRYFNSHQAISYEDYNTVAGENILGLNDAAPMKNKISSHIREEKTAIAQCLSPMAQHSGDSGEVTCSSDSNCMALGNNSPMPPLGDYPTVRLTESLMNKHNTEMERELMKLRRESRSSSKGDREKNTNPSRQKKKEHLARCNASFQPTGAGAANTEHQPHGLKRSSKQLDLETSTHKHHCSSPRQLRRKQRPTPTNAATQPSSTITTTAAASHWQPTPVNNMNTYLCGMGIPQQMSIMSPVPTMAGTMPGMIPMYYAPATTPHPHTQHMPTTSANHDPSIGQHNHLYPSSAMMMYGQPMYAGQPFMYSPISPHISYSMPQTHMMGQSMQPIQYSDSMNPIGLTGRNYEEACKPSLTLKPTNAGSVWRDKKRAELRATSSKTDDGSGDSNAATNALTRSTDAVADTNPKNCLINKMHRFGNKEETPDKTDGESSYSSFYSSFFKTDSGSAEESGDAKNVNDKRMRAPSNTASYEPSPAKKIAKRKMEPPWMEQVCVTSELIYKYKVLTKSMDEVLTADKQKMKTLEQPSLVNEQLSQLYLDLHLEGVAAKLTLEEGITSSSSSGEESSTNVTKPAFSDAAPREKKRGKKLRSSRRKREYSKLVMIYEEDAPLPSPNDGEAEIQGGASSTTC